MSNSKVYFSPEKDIEEENIPVECYEFSNSSKFKLNVFTPHWQILYELIYVIKGSIIFNIDNSLYTVKENDFLLISPSQIHSPEKSLTEEYHFYCFVFSEKTLNPFGKNDFFKKYFKSKTGNYKIFRNFYDHTSPVTKEYTDIAYNILKSQTNKEWGYELNIQIQLMNLFYKLIMSHDYISESTEENYQTYVQHLLIIINSYYDHDINLSVIAHEAGTSYSYLSRKFKEAIGQSPQYYLINTRLEHARNRLINSDNSSSISAIAESCGFQDMSYFSKCFRKKYGLTPSEYAKKGDISADAGQANHG